MTRHGDVPSASDSERQAAIAALQAELAEYKRTSQELASATARTNAIFDVVADGIITIDETGSIESVNPAVARMFGYKPSELIGRNVKCLMPPPYEEEHDDYLARYRQTGIRRIIGIGREVNGKRKDGTRFPIELSVSEGFVDDRRFYAGVLRDISEEKAAQTDLRDSNDRIRAILDSAVDGILAIDEAGTILSANPAAIELFGYSSEELIGENVRMLMPSSFAKEHDQYLRHYLETGEAKIIGAGREVSGRRKDGSVCPLYLAVSEATAAGRRIFTGIVRDLTEIRAAEERARNAEQLASISTLTAGIAHDIGAPMNVILGYAKMLQRSIERQEDRERLETIVEQVRRITDLVHTLLNMARPRSPVRAAVDLRALLEHALAFLGEKFRSRGVVVEHELGASSIEIAGDRDRLEQVFLNLFLNAVDAMPEGGTLRVTLSAPGSEHVEVRVVDTGSGVPEELRERLFEPFFTTKDRGHGTGLGLAVAKGIVTEHHGTIALANTENGQTEFRLQFPAATA